MGLIQMRESQELHRPIQNLWVEYCFLATWQKMRDLPFIMRIPKVATNHPLRPTTCGLIYMTWLIVMNCWVGTLYGSLWVSDHIPLKSSMLQLTSITRIVTFGKVKRNLTTRSKLYCLRIWAKYLISLLICLSEIKVFCLIQSKRG